MVDGYEFFNKRDFVTVFSAPDYCGEFDNKAAVLIVDKHLRCKFDFLQPLKRLRVESKQMVKLFKECIRFESIFPFNKVEITDMKKTLDIFENDYIPIKQLNS